MKKRLRLALAFGMAACAALALFPLPEERAQGAGPFFVERPSPPRALSAVFAALAGGAVTAAGMGVVIRARNIELRRQRRLLAKKQEEIDRLAEINRRQERELAARNLVAPAAMRVFKGNILN